MTGRDAMLSVFMSNKKKEVFHSVEHRHQIWREDPFDVESVHDRARVQFQRLLSQVTTPPGLEAGRILLLIGESGSGKTHLVRSFRNHVHVNGLGFVGYMQMTTTVLNYGRYLVSNLIDSLDQPYYESLGTTTGLLRLSNAVAARCGDTAAVASLSDNAGLDPDAVIDLVERAADRLISQPRYADLDLDLVRALLFLQRQDPALKKRVVKYLRCEELPERDARHLGGISPKRSEDDAQKLVEHLGRLMWAFDARSLVLCVDQFEDLYQLEDAEARFRRVMASLCAIADQVPSSIIVIACLADYYDVVRTRLTRSTLDRIENDPPPVRLVSGRSAEEVEMIVRQRLRHLYEACDIKRADGASDPLYPIPPAFVQKLSGLRIRDVLDECRAFRDACVEAGRIVEPPQGKPGPRKRDDDDRSTKAAKERIEREWNDFVAQTRDDLPETDAELAELFGWAIRTSADELESGYRFEVHVDGEHIEVRVMIPTSKGLYRLGEELLLAFCNKAPQGGGFRAQLDAAVKRAKHRIPVLIRCGEFPSGPRSAQALADIIKSKGGRKAVVEDSDWRKVAAFRRFREAQQRQEHFMEWLREENHLSRLLPLIHVLDLDHLDRFDGEPAAGGEASAPSPTPAPRSKADNPRTPARAAAPPEHRAPTAPKNEAIRASAFGVPEGDGSSTLKSPAAQASTKDSVPRDTSGAIALGVTGELVAQQLTVDVEALTGHAAFLGSTGSGKTTLALNVIEQLLLRGVPAILVDRKGDLAAYARSAPWQERHADPVLDDRRQALRERLDVALFTPGHREGRPLGISLMPRGLGTLKDLDRDQAAGYAAQALGDMLGYKDTRKDKALRVILIQAFRLCAAHGEAERLDLELLIALIANEDPALVASLGRLDTRLFKELVQHLETLKLGSSELLSSSGDQLDADLLLGLGLHARPGRTRLSIVNTKFLGDNARILFWVSQLLLSLTRWVTRAPSPQLQAVVLFDEADVYLPAQSQPATKGPMENLLRRARSGGLGILLATQSPGDLDYKCRDNVRSWFAGRITQSVALEKMKPLLSEARVNVSARIPGQRPGEFHLLQDGRVTSFRAHRSFLQAEQVPEDEILTLASQRKAALAT
ncbi:helicase HerA domain-containing protein [Sorangium sp. KYC3313]|uniref:helicase HerA domain-containing protein n=1 Tax=Sorangium sp. KYC3313 TaxID=3449740 RepID=UPI003F8CA058